MFLEPMDYILFEFWAGEKKTNQPKNIVNTVVKSPCVFILLTRITSNLLFNRSIVSSFNASSEGMNPDENIFAHAAQNHKKLSTIQNGMAKSKAKAKAKATATVKIDTRTQS